MALIAVVMISGQSECKSVSTETQKAAPKASDPATESDPGDPMRVPETIPGWSAVINESTPGRRGWLLE